MEMTVLLSSINRFAVLLEPGEPYLTWAKVYPDPDPELTMEKLRLEGGSIYLIPDTCDNPENWLKRNFKALFEEELNAWCSAEHLWPARRTYKSFRSFFNISFHSMLFDTLKSPIEKDEP